MTKRIDDILDKIIAMDHPKGRTKPAETGVIDRNTQDIENAGRVDSAAAHQAQRRRTARERVARIIETGFIE
ncbi:MAG: hypothetical protein U0822_22000 [Anaerolineae bacterium]